MEMPENTASERMSGIDTAWLRMERPTNLMVITGVMILAESRVFMGRRVPDRAAECGDWRRCYRRMMDRVGPFCGAMARLGK